MDDSFTFAEFWSALTLSAGFNATLVVIGTTVLGIASGLIGTFAMLRKRAMMSDALAHATLPGLALAYIIAEMLGVSGKSLPILLFGAACSGAFGILLVQLLSRRTRLSEDTSIGIVLSVFFGFGIVLLSIIQGQAIGNPAGLHHFIYGQTAAINTMDAYILGFGAVLALIVTTTLLKEFRLLCFDSQFAAAQGWPVTRLDLVLMGLVVIVTICGLQAVGLILIVAFLTIPPVAARFWSDRLITNLWAAPVIGGLSGYFGAAASAAAPRAPAGAVIVLTAGLFFVIGFLFAPRRGVLARVLQERLLKRRILEEHLLRHAYEETRSPVDRLINPKIFSNMSRSDRGRTLRGLTRKALIAAGAGDDLLLTEAGYLEAVRLTKNHRLWEHYILTHGGLATSHVDFSADFVEHDLTPEIVAKIERELHPRAQPVPPSVHEIGPTGEKV
jgi:manganese/zinc/iron transport system permease protein